MVSVLHFWYQYFVYVQDRSLQTMTKTDGRPIGCCVMRPTRLVTGRFSEASVPLQTARLVPQMANSVLLDNGSVEITDLLWNTVISHHGRNHRSARIFHIYNRKCESVSRRLCNQVAQLWHRDRASSINDFRLRGGSIWGYYRLRSYFSRNKM